MQSPEARHVQNQLRLAREVDVIGDRAARVLKQAANRIVRQLSTTGGAATSQALMAQLAQIQAVLQEAGITMYSQFVDDLATAQARWTGRDALEVRAEIESAVDQGLMSQETASAGPAVGKGINAQQQALFSQQALRTAATMGPLELTVKGSSKQPYSLAKEYSNAFLQPDGRSTQQALAQQVQRLQDTFERSIRQAVVTGQTTQDLVRDLKGEGGPGLIDPNVNQIQNIARTGAQSVANAVQHAELMNNDAVAYVRYSATLDRRTSPICRELDGEVYKKEEAPVPPLHFRCRSTLVAHIPGRERGSRSMTMMVEEEDGKVRSYGAYSPKLKGKLTQAQEALLQKNKSGTPPTYEEWLRAQPAAAQDSILGAKNGRRFRANDGSLTKSATAAQRRLVKAQPKPLTKKQIKPLPKPKVDPPAKPKVDPPPAKPPAPVGTKPAPVKPPKKAAPKKAAPKADPDFALVNKQLGLSQAQWDAKSPQAKALSVKAAQKKAAPKPKPTPAPTPSPKTKPVFNTPKNQKKIAQLQNSLAFQEKQLAKATTPFGAKSMQAGIDKTKKDLAALGVTAPSPQQQLQEASKILLTAKPGSPEQKAAMAQVKAAKAAMPAPKPNAAEKTKLPARVKGPPTARIKSENKKVLEQGDRRVSDVEHEPLPQDLGWDADQMGTFRRDLKNWSGNGYRQMRGAQLTKNKARPPKGSRDWVTKDDFQKGYSDDQRKGWLQDADNLEDFISRAPKYEGQVHRGIFFEDPKAADKFMDDLANKRRVNTLESWSADESIASDFAKGQTAGGVRKTDPGIEVRLHVENRHGAPVAGFSGLASEDEVLMPSRVRYRLLRREEFTAEDAGVGFDNLGKNRKRIELYVEQIED